MANVTVTGAGRSAAIPFQSAQQAAIAQSLATTISNQLAAGTLTAVDAVGSTAPAGTTPEALFVANSGAVLLNPAVKAVVVSAPAAVNLLGDPETNQSVIAGSGGLNYITNGGSGSIVAAGGTNRLITSADGTAGWYVNTGDGNDTVLSLTGDDTIAAGLGNNAVLLGTGSNLVDVTGRDTVVAATGTETVAVETGGSAVVFGGGSKLVFVGGDLADTVLAGSGSATIFGGTAGGLYIGGTGGNNQIYAAGTIVGGGGGDQLYATGSIASAVHAASGNETLSSALSSGADTLFAGSGTDSITLGAGQNTVVAGSGTASVFAGVTSAVYEFTQGASGKEVIQGFNAGSDTISLSGYGSNEAARAVASARVANGGTTITLSDNTQVTFANVTDISKTHFTG